MRKSEGSAVVKVQMYNGSKENPAKSDVNGLYPVILVGIAGDMPRRSIVSGTVASSRGLSPEGTYLVNWRVTDIDPEYGANINWVNEAEVTGGVIELLQVKALVGPLTYHEVATGSGDSANPVEEEEGDENAKPIGSAKPKKADAQAN